MTQFYTAPTAIRALMCYGPDIISNYDLSSLRVLGSVGEPINPEAWRWYSEHVSIVVQSQRAARGRGGGVEVGGEGGGELGSCAHCHPWLSTLAPLSGFKEWGMPAVQNASAGRGGGSGCLSWSLLNQSLMYQ